ncbi:hypothetical protein H8356DRAFT_1343815 [Neocallimastix lanati (nom. inval.)]|nr:hypothetical protein H8356DRAFT_1343815 [Neocallimastix sp. JGI-2020a]
MECFPYKMITFKPSKNYGKLKMKIQILIIKKTQYTESISDNKVNFKSFPNSKQIHKFNLNPKGFLILTNILSRKRLEEKTT